jgi:hypothetical protein
VEGYVFSGSALRPYTECKKDILVESQQLEQFLSSELIDNRSTRAEESP